MKLTRFIALILALLCASLLFGCTAQADTPPQEEPLQQETEQPTPPPDSLFSIAATDIAAFTVIRPEQADREIIRCATTLLSRIESTYGVKLAISTDGDTPEDPASPYEIVVGVTKRTDTPSLANADSAVAYVKNGRLYLCASEETPLQALIETIFGAAINADGTVKPLHLEEGYMKKYQGKMTLRLENGERAKKQIDFVGFDYGVTGHNKGYEAYPESKLETQIRLAAELGIKIYRFNYNPVTDKDFAYLTNVLDLCDAYGLDMMLVLDDFGGTPEEIAAKHEKIATRCQGRIAYYQIFNETDVYAMHKDDGSIYHQPVGTGEHIAQFNPARVEEIEQKLRASIEVFREFDPEAKLVVNFAFKHYAMLKAFHDAGLRWDIIGVDWYSDMEGGEPLADFLPRVQAALPDYEYMICECNIWAHTPYTEEEQSAYLESFVLSLINSGKIENLTAIIFYELLDEPAFGNGESHFGLVQSTRDGTPLEKKQAYYAIQKWLCGGEVSATYTLQE
jgi:hypothetical protein